MCGPARLLRAIAIAALPVLLAGCGGRGDSVGRQAVTAQRDAGSSTVTAERADRSRAPRISLRRVGDFAEPTHVTSMPGSAGIVVVERAGRVIHVAPGGERRTLVDITGQTTTDAERGLLSAAFHPRFERNGRLFLNYTNVEGDTRVVEYRLDPGGDAPASRVQEVLAVDQPYENHNGGLVAFGPDGKLYVGMGDGGSGGDPGRRAQDPGELLGKMLRIDVGSGAAGDPPEVWATGLRNPWRFSFDRATGDLYIADVGQDRFEEIDVQPSGADAGANYGWNAFEGFEPFDGGRLAARARPVDPVYVYGRDDGCSITGGFVYRGRAVRSLRGWYVFADFCREWIRAYPVDVPADVRWREADVRELDGVPSIASFGEDADGELYVASLEGGVWRVVDGGPA